MWANKEMVSTGTRMGCKYRWAAGAMTINDCELLHWLMMSLEWPVRFTGLSKATRH